MINKALDITIRNNNGSAQNLYVGIEEEALGKIILAPGESLTLGISRPDYFYSKLSLYFKWASPDVSNGGFVIVNQPQDEEVC